jgi:sugar-specific transcriptional regulator TrmB
MIKQLGKIDGVGRIEGVIEDIDVNGPKFKQLSIEHQTLIVLNRKREQLKQELKRTENQISKLKEKLKPLAESKAVNWVWIWYKKMTSIKWKEEFIAFNGTEAAERVAQKYEQKSYPQVGVQYVDPIETRIVEDTPTLKSRLSKLKLKSK